VESKALEPGRLWQTAEGWHLSWRDSFTRTKDSITAVMIPQPVAPHSMSKPHQNQSVIMVVRHTTPIVRPKRPPQRLNRATAAGRDYQIEISLTLDFATLNWPHLML
jgi:hypothetical protein